MNKKKVFFTILVLIIIAIIAIYISGFEKSEKDKFVGVNTSATSTKNINFDPLNFSYEIQGEKVNVKDGNASSPIVPGSAENLETTVPNELIAIGDLNKDNKNDAVVILAQSSGGSGLFYYLTSIVNDAGVVKNSNSVFIGDRILIENINISNGEIVVNYLDRNEDDSMADDPHVKVKKNYKFLNGELTEIK